MKNQAFSQNFKHEFVAKLVAHIGLFIDGDKVLEFSSNLTDIDCKEEKFSFL